MYNLPTSLTVGSGSCWDSRPEITEKRAAGASRCAQTGSSMDFASGVNSFGPVGGHVPAVLQAHAEFPGNIDARLVGETHACLKRRGVAVHQVGAARGRPCRCRGRCGARGRAAVARAPALLLVVVRAPRRRSRRRARRAGGLQRDLLAALDRVPDLALARAWARRRRRCGRCRTGSRAPCSRQSISTTEPSRTVCGLMRAVRIGAGLVQQHQRELRLPPSAVVAAPIRSPMSLGGHAGAGRAAWAWRIGRDRDVVGGLHAGRARPAT